MSNLNPTYSKKDPEKRGQWKKFKSYFDESTIFWKPPVPPEHKWIWRKRKFHRVWLCLSKSSFFKIYCRKFVKILTICFYLIGIVVITQHYNTPIFRRKNCLKFECTCHQIFSQFQIIAHFLRGSDVKLLVAKNKSQTSRIRFMIYFYRKVLAITLCHTGIIICK
jgi:hypothetical protein